MVQPLKRQCRVLWRDWLALCVGIVWGMGIFGFVLYQILLVFAEDTGAYVPLGTILAAFTGAIFAATLTITQMGLYFNVEVSMGCIRKHFFLSYTVCVCAASLFAAGMVILFCMAENALNGALHPELPVKLEILPYLLRWSAPAAILLVIATLFGGALILRFGRPARIALLTVWIIVCIGFPQMVNAASDSVLGRLANACIKAVSSVPAGAWGIIGVLFSIAALGSSYLFLRRQQVTM